MALFHPSASPRGRGALGCGGVAEGATGGFCGASVSVSDPGSVLSATVARVVVVAMRVICDCLQRLVRLVPLAAHLLHLGAEAGDNLKLLVSQCVQHLQCDSTHFILGAETGEFVQYDSGGAFGIPIVRCLGHGLVICGWVVHGGYSYAWQITFQYTPKTLSILCFTASRASLSIPSSGPRVRRDLSMP